MSVDYRKYYAQPGQPQVQPGPSVFATATWSGGRWRNVDKTLREKIDWMIDRFVEGVLPPGWVGTVTVGPQGVCFDLSCREQPLPPFPMTWMWLALRRKENEEAARRLRDEQIDKLEAELAREEREIALLEHEVLFLEQQNRDYAKATDYDYDDYPQAGDYVRLDGDLHMYLVVGLSEDCKEITVSRPRSQSWKTLTEPITVMFSRVVATGPSPTEMRGRRTR